MNADPTGSGSTSPNKRILMRGLKASLLAPYSLYCYVKFKQNLTSIGSKSFFLNTSKVTKYTCNDNIKLNSFEKLQLQLSYIKVNQYFKQRIIILMAYNNRLSQSLFQFPFSFRKFNFNFKIAVAPAFYYITYLTIIMYSYII